MKNGGFLLDHGRVAAGSVFGLISAIAVLALAAANRGSHLPLRDVAYAFALGVLWVAGALIVEHVVRRDAYRFLRGAFQTDDWRAVSALRADGTREQREWIALAHHVCDLCAHEQTALEDRRQFYELFLTRFAHQMKTPLTVMQLLDDELRRHAREAASPAMADLLDSLAEERDRLAAHVDLILQTARLSSFALDTRLETVDVGDVLREAINEHKAAWIRRSLYPRLEVVGSSPIFVSTDRKWFLLVCEQIVRNALQYGVRPGQTGPCVFSVRAEREGEAVRVSFADSGIGIPKRDLRRVFEPFFTGSNGRVHARATGMGLYLVKTVCDALGHRVEVESVENEGTVVILWMEDSVFLSPLFAGAKPVDTRP